jgi:hypothetical protein
MTLPVLQRQVSSTSTPTGALSLARPQNLVANMAGQLDTGQDVGGVSSLLAANVGAAVSTTRGHASAPPR